jgi:hypothetical protein
MPTSDEILGRHHDVLELIRRAVSGAKLKPAEAVGCIDFLNGLTAALNTHEHMRYVIFESAREITAKAAAAKEAESKITQAGTPTFPYQHSV